MRALLSMQCDALVVINWWWSVSKYDFWAMDSLICHQYKLSWVRTGKATCTGPTVTCLCSCKATAWQMPCVAVSWDNHLWNEVCLHAHTPIILLFVLPLSYLNTIIEYNWHVQIRTFLICMPAKVVFTPGTHAAYTPSLGNWIGYTKQPMKARSSVNIGLLQDSPFCPAPMHIVYSSCTEFHTPFGCITINVQCMQEGACILTRLYICLMGCILYIHVTHSMIFLSSV